jgi:hypothetical protein
MLAIASARWKRLAAEHLALPGEFRSAFREVVTEHHGHAQVKAPGGDLAAQRLGAGLAD